MNRLPHRVVPSAASEPTSDPAVTRNTELSGCTSPTVTVSVVSGRGELIHRSATIGPDISYGLASGGLVNVRPLICALLSSVVQLPSATMPAVHCADEREHAPVSGCHGICAEPPLAALAVASEPSYRLGALDPEG